MTKPATFACALFASVLSAQTEADSRPDLGPPATVPDGAPPGSDKIRRELLREHAYWLADDARNGRHTASQGQQATAAYVAEWFEKLGLKPLGDKRSYLQSYPLERLVLHKSTGIEFGKHKLKDGFAVLHSSDKDKVRLRGKFQFLGNGAAFSGLAKGRVPVFAIGKDDSSGGSGNDLRAVQRYDFLAKQLHKAGAKGGVVCLLNDGSSLANTLNYRGLMPDHGVMSFDRPSKPPVRVPLLVLNAENSKHLLAHLGVADGKAADDKASGKVTIQVKADKKAAGSNVVGWLEGSGRKKQAIVISAHHDHVGTRLDGDRFNGADDNASGTAGLLALAEAFAGAAERPDRSIVFLSVSGEELGLWGSAYYAEHPTWSKERIVANINIDMIGRAGRAGDAIQMQITPSHQHEKYSTLVQDAVALAGKFGITFSSGDQYYRRSDHYNFAKEGIPVVFFCDGEHPDYHQVTDHADKLDYPAMESITRLAYWTAWNVANASGKPKDLGKQDGW